MRALVPLSLLFLAGCPCGNRFLDEDGDGWGDPFEEHWVCKREGWSEQAGDCDDADPHLHPDADEHCDGIDEDCDGSVDDDAVDAETFYADADADGYGDPGAETRACEAAPGLVEDASDCDDARADAWPGAPETCNEADDDCDGTIDEDPVDAPTWYEDGDGDGYAGGSGTVACAPPGSGWSSVADDCDDALPGIHPGAEDVCDAHDNDCDGQANDPFDDEHEENDVVSAAAYLIGDDEEVTIEAYFPGPGDDADWFEMDTFDGYDGFSDHFVALAEIADPPAALTLNLCLWRNDVTATPRLIGCDDDPSDGLYVANHGTWAVNDGNLHFAEVIRVDGWSCDTPYALRLANSN